MANDPSNPNLSAGFDKPDVSVSVAENLVSILIPCLGQLEYTKLCVPSVLRYSRDPFEMIFMDIGSLDGTADYLAGIQASCGVRTEIIRTATDLEIGDAVAEALRRARGQYLVLLNNDTVVTEGWLNHMIGLVVMSPAVGMVGPMSNYAAPPQLVENVPYRIGPARGGSGKSKTLPENFLVDTRAVYEFSKKHENENANKWIEVERLGGFCLLLKREVIKKIESQSSIREWSDLKLFDTDILSMKARQAGYTLACCRDLYIHHFGSRIFAHGAPGGDAAKIALN